MSEKISFQPTKKLFVNVLTRDLTVRECIFDLLDNSVDSYTRNDIKKIETIKIVINKELFEIYDSCGGIELKRLKEEVFRFGANDFEKKKPTIGVYGIGLKRAIFKLGENIIFETDDGKNYSKFILNVKEWIDTGDDNWDINLDITSTTKLKTGEYPYTKITLTSLREEAKETFNQNFISDLKREISTYYTKYISSNKIKFYINGEICEEFNLTLTISKDYKPIKKEITIQEIKVTMMCIIHSKHKKRNKFNKIEADRGWNVFMNDRLIVVADISENTGWIGEKSYLPKFHSIYNQFKGIVYLLTEDPDKLPMNTSKSGFNTESMIYKELIQQMCDFARPLIDHLSDKYDKQKKEIDEKNDNLFDEDDETEPKEIKIDEVEFVDKFKPPIINKINSKKGPKLTKISYERPKVNVDKLKELFNVNSNEKVGEETFDYFWNNEMKNE